MSRGKSQARCLAVIHDLIDASDGDSRIIRKEWYTGVSEFKLYANNAAAQALGKGAFAIRCLDSGDLKIWRLRYEP